MTEFDAIGELYPQLRLTTAAGEELDFSGLESLSARLQLGAADELTIKMAAQMLDGTWRPDQPVWLVGATITVECGYNGNFDKIQSFEVVSTTVDYPGDSGEVMTVRGVSDLARAARNKNHRTYKGDDASVIEAVCSEYGWTNGVTAALSPTSDARMKENGKSDLQLLKRIANEALIGGPRVTRDNVLIMPEPSVGTLAYTRGIPIKTQGARRLHSIQVNRDGGANNTTVAVVSWDPAKNEFVELDFEADEFGGDPKVVYEGKLSTKELRKEATTQGLLLAVIDAKGHDKSERIDVLSSGRFLNETDAEALARRWFLLREKLSRWSNIKVDGNIGLEPYTSFEIDGNLAAMDRGVWLPIVVEHIFDSSGWTCDCRSIRVVDEAVITPV